MPPSSPTDLVTTILELSQQNQTPLPTEGVVHSYDPTEGTVTVFDGLTGAVELSATEHEEPIIYHDIPLLTNHIGAQGGPIGGERCLIIPFHGGKAAMLYHGGDDSPGVPPGENHIYLRSKVQALALQAFLKVQVDATRLGHQRKLTFLAPIVVLGADASADVIAIVRKKDLLQFKRDVLQSVQQALNEACKNAAAGNGIPPPTIADVNVQASQTGFSA